MTRYFLPAGGILVLLAVFFAADHRIWFTDDRNHSDGLLLAEEFANARAENRSSASVIAVNGGNWFALCLAGPGESPQEALRRFGQKNRLRVPKVQQFRSWLYVGSVPKGEIALVILTNRFSIRSRRLPNLTGNPDFKSACAMRNDVGLNLR